MAAADAETLRPLLDVVADELNVREVRLATAGADASRVRVKVDFRALGPRLGPRVKDLAAALGDDDGSFASSLVAGSRVVVETASGPIEIGPEDVELVREGADLAGSASDGSVTVTLDLRIDDELRAEGIARELIREVQDARKAAGLEVSDRIELWLASDDAAIASAVQRHGELIAGEVLATSVGGAAPANVAVTVSSVEGSEVRVGLRRA